MDRAATDLFALSHTRWEAFIEGQFTPEGARRAKILIDGLFYEGETIVWALDDGRMLARTAFLHEQHRNIGRVYNWLNPAVQGELLVSPLQIGAPPCAELDDVLVPLHEDRQRLWWRSTPFSINRFLFAPRESELRAWRNSACG